MTRLVQRLVWSVFVLWCVITGSFVVNFGLPGDPVRAIAGPQARPADLQAIREQMGLDQSLRVQYVLFLKRLVHTGPAHDAAADKAHRSCKTLGPLHFDLGMSYQQRRPVLTLLLEKLPATLLLAVAALLVQVSLGVATGTLAALHRGTFFDYGVIITVLLLISMPTFLLGIGLQYLFAYYLHWLPLDGDGKTFFEKLRHVALPAMTLGFFGAAYYTRIVRDEVLSQLNQDHVRTARAKGASLLRTTLVHVLRNVSLPLVTLVGLELGGLVGGAIVTEQLFRWPGLGRLSIDAVMERDGPVLMGTVLVASVAVVLANLLVDLSYSLLDPRTRR